MMRYLVVLVVLLGTSCTRVDVSSPEKVYRDFYKAVAEKDWDRAFGHLSPEARDVIVRQRTLLKKAIGDDEVRSALFLEQHADMITPLKTIDVVSREADEVTIEIRVGSCDQNEPCVSTVKLRLEGGRYVIAPHLPANLIKTSKEGT
jgi:hypothetical protein